MKVWYESKTLWFNILYGVVAIAGLFGFAEFSPDTNAVEIVGVLIAAINIVLRLLSNKSIVRFAPRG